VAVWAFVWAFPVQILWRADADHRNLQRRSCTSGTAHRPAIIRINQTLQIPLNCRYSTVTAGLCQTLGQEYKSVLNQALVTIEIFDYSPKTDLLRAQPKVRITTLTYLQPSANLQSP